MRGIDVARQESSAWSLSNMLRCKARKKVALLVVLCGASHAGKSRFARGLGRRFSVVSSDEIRDELAEYFGRAGAEARVWKVFEAMKRQALKEGRNVVLDACHMSERARWHALQGAKNRQRKICIVFDVPLRSVRDRCVRSKRVPIGEVERMWRAFQEGKPTPKDLKRRGFNEVYFVKE